MYVNNIILRLILILVLFAGPAVGWSQDCGLHLHGLLVDEHNNEPLALANLYIEETGTGTSSDDQGRFVLTGLCPGPHTIVVSHLLCETQKFTIIISQDTSVIWYLEHHEHVLSTVTVSGVRSGQEQSHTSHVLTSQVLEKLSGRSIGEMLATVSGVTLIRTGPGIVKPMVHGLYGQRIQTVQSGLIQEGQQWGLEHALEIDPTMAGSISVVKGAAAIKYGGSASAAAIIIEPEPLPVDGHMHGQVMFTGMSNHRLMQVSGQLEGAYRADRPWRWRILTTGKWAGDSHTPDYNLSNTGQREWNAGFSTGFTGSKQSFHLDMTSFNTRLGILRGAHIGNLTDLQAALKRDVPFFTEPFTFEINNPHQRVHHQLLKAKYTLTWQDRHTLKVQYGAQLNQRQEYDIRRGTRNELPALSLNLLSHQVEVANVYQVNARLSHETGVNFAYLNNRNVPGTGVSPLIPNYRSYRPSIYQVSRWKNQYVEWDGGIRYDFQWLQAKYFEQTTLLTPTHGFHNFALSAGALFWPEHKLNMRINAGWNQRNPQVNELYSNGLHHGSAVIEEGDKNLRPESSLKITPTITFEPRHEWHFEATPYFHSIRHFIYLQPQPEPRLTVRGAFPVFSYEQSNARLLGLDLSAHLSVTSWMHWDSKYYFVRGQNLEENKPLALMPADRWLNAVEIIIPAQRVGRSNEVTFSAYKVWPQKRYNPGEDFAPPPPGYFLVDAQLSKGWQWGAQELKVQLGVQNLLNTVYRDYLNRLRYYADETGRNIELRIKYIF